MVKFAPLIYRLAWAAPQWFRGHTYACGGLGVRTTSSIVMMSFARSASQNLRGDWPGTSNSSRLTSDWPSLRMLRALAPATTRAIAEAENLIAATRGFGFRRVRGRRGMEEDHEWKTFFVEASTCGRSGR
jgi:hypothetical protein